MCKLHTYIQPDILPTKFLRNSGLEVMTFTKIKRKESKRLNFRFRSGRIKELVIKTPGFIMLLSRTKERDITIFSICNEDLGITNDILRYFVADCS